MNGTPEMTRQQMDVTMSHLTDKMESLEHQVSETVQSTGTAVNATVGAVQETVETVTGAVQGAVTSVTNALNLRRQVNRHPWLVLGGSVVLGYLAHGFLTGRAKKLVVESPVIVLDPSASNDDDGTGNRAIESATTSAAIIAAYESGKDHSASHRGRSVAIDALVGVIQAVAIHAVPRVMDYFAHNSTTAATSPPEGTCNRQDTLPDTAQSLRITPSNSFRSGNSF